MSRGAFRYMSLEDERPLDGLVCFYVVD